MRQQRLTALGSKRFKTKHLMRINLPGWGWGWLGSDYVLHMQSLGRGLLRVGESF